MNAPEQNIQALLSSIIGCIGEIGAYFTWGFVTKQDLATNRKRLSRHLKLIKKILDVDAKLLRDALPEGILYVAAGFWLDGQRALATELSRKHCRLIGDELYSLLCYILRDDFRKPLREGRSRNFAQLRTEYSNMLANSNVPTKATLAAFNNKLSFVSHMSDPRNFLCGDVINAITRIKFTDVKW